MGGFQAQTKVMLDDVKGGSIIKNNKTLEKVIKIIDFMIASNFEAQYDKMPKLKCSLNIWTLKFQFSYLS